jgi:hypothetical protein
LSAHEGASVQCPECGKLDAQWPELPSPRYFGCFVWAIVLAGVSAGFVAIDSRDAAALFFAVIFAAASFALAVLGCRRRLESGGADRQRVDPVLAFGVAIGLASGGWVCLLMMVNGQVACGVVLVGLLWLVVWVLGSR